MALTGTLTQSAGATGGDGVRRDPALFVHGDGADGDRLELLVTGMHCAGCISKVERAMHALPGMRQARVNLSTGRLSLAWDRGRIAPAAVVAAIERLGFTAAPFDPGRGADAGCEARRRLLQSLGITGFASMNVMLLSVAVWAGEGEMGEGTRTLFLWISALIAMPAALLGSRPFFTSAWAALRAGRTNMDVPIAAAILGALGLSLAETLAGGTQVYFEAAVMLPFLLLVGRYLDHLLRDRARAAARDLMEMQSGTALRLDGAGNAQPVKAAEIVPGDRLLLMPGDRLLVDARVVAGEGLVDRALVSGESRPVPAGPGTLLRAGELSLTGRLTLAAVARAGESLLAELTRLVEAGEQRRDAYVRWADGAARAYVPLVHGLAALAALGWLTLGGADLRTALTIAIAVLIITCPCALGLAVPAVQIVATGRLFRVGVLVKSGDALERLAKADVVLIDKTGTLTFGRPRLTDAAALAPQDLAAAAALARASRHPYARAIAEAAGPGPVAGDVVETAGQGLSGTVGGEAVRLGSAGFVGAPDAPAVRVAETGEVWLSRGGHPAVRIACVDDLRPDAAALIAGLRARGLAVEMHSGDRQGPAAATAAALGLADWRAEVTPADKWTRAENLRAAGRTVLMIGDGLNDTAALAAAHVAISFGEAAGPSQSAADLILTGQRLLPVLEAIDVARAARARVMENFAASALYNALAVPAAVAGLVTPLIAAVAMSASSLVVTLNALRLSAPGGRRWTRSPS